MAKRAPVAILRANLEEHPPVKAWSTLTSTCVTPKSVHVFRQRPWSAIYRLAHAGPDGSHVMVKRCRQTAAWSVVRQCWPNFTPRAIRQLAQVGRIFQWLAAINWKGLTLASDQPAFLRYAMEYLRVYRAEPPGTLELAPGEGP